jgi:beta-lactamase regulating signal transducer with metallopeptidase domain
VIAAAAVPFSVAADSARAVATVYTVSLLATIPLAIVTLSALFVRRTTAEGRTLIWRCAIVALLLVFVGRLLPLHWMAWVVPSALASPLVALGRVQVTSSALHIVNTQGSDGSLALVRAVLVVYVAGLLMVIVPTIVAATRLRRTARQARPLDAVWRESIDRACVDLGVTRRIRVVMSTQVAVPLTWGCLTPVIVVPPAALEWSREQRYMMLLHELSHIRSADWVFKVLARVTCALYWFHPGVWWVAGSLDADGELACDDRVIAAGARRSDYAELLALAADRLLPLYAGLALSTRRGLRPRLRAVLDARRDVRPVARRWTLVAAVSTVTIAAPVSAVQLAPTRDVLTSLMRDTRWETRAYAVIGLASRADSVAVARSAAERDPSPGVRAWARYALDQRGVPDSASLPLHP